MDCPDSGQSQISRLSGFWTIFPDNNCPIKKVQKKFAAGAAKIFSNTDIVSSGTCTPCFINFLIHTYWAGKFTVHAFTPHHEQNEVLGLHSESSFRDQPAAGEKIEKLNWCTKKKTCANHTRMSNCEQYFPNSDSQNRIVRNSDNIFSKTRLSGIRTKKIVLKKKLWGVEVFSTPFRQDWSDLLQTSFLSFLRHNYTC